MRSGEAAVRSYEAAVRSGEAASHQHVSIVHVEVDKQQEGEKEGEDGEHGAFPEAPHPVSPLPHQPQGCVSLREREDTHIHTHRRQCV